MSGARSTIWPRSTYSQSRPSSSGLAVNGGHRMGSLPTMARTRTCGMRTGDAGCPWYTDSRAVACRSLIQPSRAPSRGTGMPSVMIRWLMTDTGAPGRISSHCPASGSHGRSVKRSAGSWVRT